MSTVIRQFSDLHNEFQQFDIPETPNDKKTILVLAGDVDLAKKDSLIEFLKKASEMFQYVIYIFGNHEYYKASYTNARQKIKDQLSNNNISNVHLLENESIVIGDVAFIGATLWTNLDNSNPLTILMVNQDMNDFKHIRIGPPEEPYQRKLSPQETIAFFTKSKEFIFNECKKFKKQGLKVVVITHHGPSFMSVSEGFRGSPLNGAYMSNLDYDIIDAKPDVWFHGHVHQTFSYDIENTKVYTNPRGYYPSQLNPLFNPLFTIEL